MEKVVVLGFAMLLILALVGCGGTSVSSEASGQGGQAVGLDEGGEDALPVVVQLVIGTFKLEGTELAVDGEQARELLPLWKAARSLTSSDTAAAQEVAAVVEQIQETMAPEQVSAIAEMGLKGADMATVMQEMGLQFGQGRTAADQGSGAGQGEGFRGGFPGGPGGMGFPAGGPPGQEMSSEMRATMEARRASGEMRLSPVMFDALIELLEERAG